MALPASCPCRSVATGSLTLRRAAVDWLGERALAGLALLSTIVGMEWPGEYSLFTNAKIDFPILRTAALRIIWRSG